MKQRHDEKIVQMECMLNIINSGMSIKWWMNISVQPHGDIIISVQPHGDIIISV